MTITLSDLHQTNPHHGASRSSDAPTLRTMNPRSHPYTHHTAKEDAVLAEPMTNEQQDKKKDQIDDRSNNNPRKSSLKTTMQVNCLPQAMAHSTISRPIPNSNEPRVTPGRSGLKNWTPLVSTS